MIGLVDLKFGEGVHSGRHRDCPGVDGSRATDIRRRIADHARRMIRHMTLQMNADSIQRQAGDVIAVGVIVSKPARFKKMVDPEVPQLDPRAFDIVSREQTQVNTIVLLKMMQQIPHSRQ